MKKNLMYLIGCCLTLTLAPGCASDSEDHDSDGGDEDSGGDSTDNDDDDAIDSDTSINIDGTPFELNGILSVSGRSLINEHGKAIQLRGMSTHGLQWYPNCITDKSLDLLAKNWGADFLRLSMYVQEEGYETDPEGFKILIDGFVEKIYARGMYALLDWHQLEPGDPNYNLELAKEYFTYMSKKHGDKGNVLYEICNEPSGVEWQAIYDYAMQIIPIIRANDPDSVIIVGTPEWCQQPDVAIDQPLPQPNIMYTEHFYAATHGQWERDIMVQALENNVPVFVTEFGTQAADGDQANDFVSAAEWFAVIDQYKVSWSNWNFSDDFRSGAVWQEGACNGSQDFSDGMLKEAGVWVKEKLHNPPDDFTY